MLQQLTDPIRWLVMAAGVVLPAIALLMPASAASGKLDLSLRDRAHARRGSSRVILRTTAEAPVAEILKRANATAIRTLGPHLHVVWVSDSSLPALAAPTEVLSISLDRQVTSARAQDLASGAHAPPSDILMPPAEREQSWQPSSASIASSWGETGGTAAREPVLDGAGIGIAMIDSGIAASHAGLSGARIVHWADFVNRLAVPYDDYGHGTHVAGILAGTDEPTAEARRGIAPGADLLVLKALDATGSGHVSDVIAALDYAVLNRRRYNIRIVNLSVAAGVYESYLTDPLTLAALRAVNAGLVVVAAAGNGGANPLGEPQYGSIAAPGNAPWVLTVGASDDRGTADRRDDTAAGFSSRGPSAFDGAAKPDLLAPGVAIESTADATSTLFGLQARARIWSATSSVSQPYLRLSGTSMAAPAVSGTVALMLQANAALTPNAVKAILHFTAEPRGGADEVTQGAGLLNPNGATALARHFLDPLRDRRSLEVSSGGTRNWSHRVIWAGQRLSGATLPHDAAAWQLGVVWGADADTTGGPLAWGRLCGAGAAECGRQ